MRILGMIYLIPLSDVYYFNTKGVIDLLSLKNPYEDRFDDFVPNSLMTPNSGNIYAYMPLETLYLIPFYLTFGDIRYGNVFADIVIACLLYNMISYKKWRWLAVNIYLIFPLIFLTEILYSSHTNIAALFLLLSFFLLKRGKEILFSFTYGMALASSQLTFISLPFIIALWIKRKLMKKFVLCFIPLFLTIIPFFIINYQEFLKDVMFFQFSRETYPLFERRGNVLISNFGLNGIFYTLTGFDLPISLRLALSILPLLFFIINLDFTFEKILRTISISSFLIIFILPKNLFLIYFLVYLPLLLLIIDKFFKKFY